MLEEAFHYCSWDTLQAPQTLHLTIIINIQTLQVGAAFPC